MECEEITKLVDGVYKNILEKFNPGARQLITAGKGYLKALHGAAAASRLFNEALAKIAMNAQQSGTNDIGAALLNVVSVYKEIQEQQMNILKAFYVDLLVPLETNLEKDTKVVQHEQKKFLQQHKVRMESYQKAVSTMKKQRKKKSSPENTEKELRSLQLLEDQKKKLDAFCEQSYKNALTQERRRYGFVLERQCSIAKHWMAYHSTGRNVIDNSLENWQEIASSREIIPTAAYENSFTTVKRLERLKDADDSYHGGHGSSQLKKSRSIDAPYGDMRTLHETSPHYSQNSLPRAKSDFNLTASSSNDHTDHGHWDQRPVVKALYAYMPSGENQLPFDEGDRIALVGGKAKGWQFGENLRTQMFGWFPIAYTNAEPIVKHERHERNERYENMHFERNGGNGLRNYQDQYMTGEHMDGAMESDSTYRRRNSPEESSPTRMFGDTINFRNQKKYRASTGTNPPRPGPPPTLPAPVPSSQQNANRMLNTSQSFCAPNGLPAVMERRKHKAQNAAQASHNRLLMQTKQSGMGATGNGVAGGVGVGVGAGVGNQMKPAAAAKTSLHSSNDSGFANEPPPQPEIDYSDEETTARVPIRRRAETNSHSHSSRDVASWTLNRNFRNSVDSQIDDKSLNAFGKPINGKMRYDLIASDDEILQASSGGIKRTKSFWKFGGGRGDDILAGMSLWQHRDLVAAPNMDEMRDENYRKTSSELEREREHAPEHEREHEGDGDLERNGTMTKSQSNNSSSSNEKRRKDSVTSMELYDEDENIYGMSPVVRESRASTALHANYTPKSRMKIMKTIEIDIENPTESERLSTIKRGQKEYQKEYRDMGMNMPQASARGHSANMRGDLDAKKRESNGMNMTSGARYAAQNGHNKHGNDLKSGHQPVKSQTQTRSKQQQQDTLPSTEDEGDSDDNGTLKMSDVHNFFDGLPNENGGISGAGGGGGGMIMKTVKRKDILKQYYTSEDESDELEIKSTSSDPYDCIVINDHLVRKDEKLRRQMQHNSYQEHQMEFQTFRATTTSANGGAGGQSTMGKDKVKSRNSNNANGSKNAKSSKQQQQQQNNHDNDAYNNNNNSTLTRNNNGSSNNNNNNSSSNNSHSTMNTPTATILPRTRLVKSSNTTSLTLERTQQQHKPTSRQQAEMNRENGMHHEMDKHFGKTYGPWYDFWDQQDQHTLVSQKSGSHSKMK